MENIVDNQHVINHDAVPAQVYTPEIPMVELAEPAAKELAEKYGFEFGKSVGHFRANSRSLPEGKRDGIVKVLSSKGNGKLLGVHIIGIHEASLIQECANSIPRGTTVNEHAYRVHTNPTLSEVVGEGMKGAVGTAAH